MSGGSDSTALLLLVMERIAEQGAGCELLAVTVDHGLRRESAEEAAWVAGFCERAGVAHRTIEWRRHASLKTGIAAAARLARYRLLAEAAEASGAQVILTGHTLNDQIETVAMRMARGTGRGLAGIAPLTLLRGRLWIVRPLLGRRREALRIFLKRRGAAWLDDPSNADMRNERARVRRSLAACNESHALRLLEQCSRAQERRIADGADAARLIGESARQRIPGLFEIDAGAVAAGGEGAVTALRALIAVTGGNEQLPDRARVTGLRDRLCGENRRGTLGGCVVERLQERIYVWREFRGAGPVPAAAESGTVWDGRWALASGKGGRGMSIVALGKTGKLPPCPGEDPPPQRILRASAATLPVLAGKGAGRKGAVRQFDPNCFSLSPAPWRLFLPAFDFALAGAVSELAGGPELPDIPAALKKLLPI